MSDELKSCPFCGSTETMDMQYDCDFWVQCAGCNCCTQVFDSEAESHKAWNTRAQPSDGALTNEGAEPVACVQVKFLEGGARPSIVWFTPSAFEPDIDVALYCHPPAQAPLVLPGRILGQMREDPIAEAEQYGWNAYDDELKRLNNLE